MNIYIQIFAYSGIIAGFGIILWSIYRSTIAIKLYRKTYNITTARLNNGEKPLALRIEADIRKLEVSKPYYNAMLDAIYDWSRKQKGARAHEQERNKT